MRTFPCDRARSTSLFLGALLAHGTALALLGAAMPAFAATNAAPSSWLHWSNPTACNTADLFSIEVRVPATSTATATYYSGLNFNQGAIGGGYAGIQNSPDNGKLFIFSLWDSGTVNPVVEYVAPGEMYAEPFGGEGTGMKSWSASYWSVAFPWEFDQWNRLVLRSWNTERGSSYGFWAWRQQEGKWHHLSRMSISSHDIGFRTGNGSFIEDWVSSGSQRREGHYANAWRRSAASQQWCGSSTAQYAVNTNDIAAGGRSYDYRDSWDAGLASDTDGKPYYYMVSGGTAITPHDPANGATLPAMAMGNDPGYPLGQLTSLALVPIGTPAALLAVNWEVDSTRATQWASALELCDNASCSGSLLQTIRDTIPEKRADTLDLSSLADGTYAVRLIQQDFLDGLDTLVQSFSLASGAVAVVEPGHARGIAAAPLLIRAADRFGADLQLAAGATAELKLTDATGRLLLHRTVTGSNGERHVTWPRALPRGLHFLQVRTGTLQSSRAIRE